MAYTLIDHTADFGIHVSAETPTTLFSEAADALFDQIIDRQSLKGETSIDLDVAGIDWPDLMVNWLRELLYLWNGRYVLIKAVEIHRLSERSLKATAYWDPYDPDRHVVRSEIKAVTYHQIRVTETPVGWESKIIFDV